MVVFSNAALSNSANIISQLGYIILLADKNHSCHVIHVFSKKSSRVVRSVLTAEVYVFTDSFEMAFTIHQDLSEMMNRNIKLTMLTDSKSIFDVITKCSQTTENPLMIDISFVREASEENEISNVGFIKTDQNPADALTKVMYFNVLSRII